MKTFRFLSLLLLSYLCSPVMGQDTITVEAYCNFDGMEPVSGKYVIQDASEESLEIVSAILAVNDIEANFILRESPCRNALATRVGKRRFILYNPEFIKKFSIDAQSKWAVWLVFAHEIAHHVHDDDFSETNSFILRKFEQKADEFACKTLYKMGASMDQMLSGFRGYSQYSPSSSHPAPRERMNSMMYNYKSRSYDFGRRDSIYSIEDGAIVRRPYKIDLQRKSNSEDKKFVGPPTPRYAKKIDSTALRFLIAGNMETTPEIKIRYFTRAIQAQPDYADAYNNRGNAYCDLGRFREGIADYTKAILLEPEDATPYNNRGLAKANSDKLKEAIQDYTQSIALNPFYMTPYYNRGEAYLKLGQIEPAIADFDKAIELDKGFPSSYAGKGCALVQLGLFKEGIEWLDRALAINPTLGYAQLCRNNAIRQMPQSDNSGKNEPKH